MTIFSPIPRIDAEVQDEVMFMGKNPYDVDEQNAPMTIADLKEKLRQRLGDAAMRTVTITVH